MTKDLIKNLMLILLIGITAFSMVRYVAELKERFRLQDNLARSEEKVAVLTQEKQNLLQELRKEKELNSGLAARNAGLKDYLGASKERISRFFRENSQIRVRLEEISTKFSILKAENRALINSHKRSYLENEQLKSKLSSVGELKKAIREIKARKFRSLDLETEGNQGFLFRDGRSTAEKVKIEVVPAGAN